MSEATVKVVNEWVGKMLEPLGLDRWQIKVLTGPNENTATCVAMPEYKLATITVDPDKLQTGDELDEIIAHELAHCPMWVLGAVADDMADVVIKLTAEPQREAIAALLKEQIRKADEDATTQVGFTFIRLLRRLWTATDDLQKARADVKSLRKQLKAK